jgi:hypothetical protein
LDLYGPVKCTAAYSKDSAQNSLSALTVNMPVQDALFDTKVSVTGAQKDYEKVVE